MTTTPTTAPLAQQTLTLLESLIDQMAERAVARHTPQETKASLWVSAKEASEILGEGYPPARVKQLGHLGEIVADRKEPEKANSPWIFLRSSLYEFSARRVFQLDQQKGRAA